jgi:hypothetical protein
LEGSIANRTNEIICKYADWTLLLIEVVIYWLEIACNHPFTKSFENGFATTCTFGISYLYHFHFPVLSLFVTSIQGEWT